MKDDLPALLGGPAVRPEGPPPWPRRDPAVEEAIAKAMRDGNWGLYNGPAMDQLEAALKRTFRQSFALPVASGTLAGEIALRALGVGPGDEVIMAAYEYEANFLNVHTIGAMPVLVDVHSHNAQLNAGLVEGAITPRTKAILVTHLHGGRVDAANLKRLGIPIIEDLAQQPGGAIGGFDLTMLSFGGSKPLSAGRGGALLTSDVKLNQKAKVLLQRGVQQWGVLSELQATVLLPQLEHLKEDADARRASVAFLRERLRTPGLRIFHTSDASDYYKTGFFHDAAAFGLSRDLFAKALRAEGIAFDAGFKALHVGRGGNRFRAAGALPNATTAHNSVMTLHHPVLLAGRQALEQVASAVEKTYRNADRLASSFRKESE